MTAPATPTIQQQAKLGIAKKVAERSERGQKLFQTQKHLINRINADTYSVPSCSTDEHYTVDYGERVEDCTCIDFGMNRGEIACKHLAAVAIMHAARRSGAASFCHSGSSSPSQARNPPSQWWPLPSS